jgi:hypothetical protein
MNHVDFYFILNEMNEKKSFKNYINFHPFWDNQDSYMVWDCDKKNGHSISISSYFQNAKCIIGKQNFSWTFTSILHKTI